MLRRPHISLAFLFSLAIALLLTQGIMMFRNFRLSAFQRSLQPKHSFWLRATAQELIRYYKEHNAWPERLEEVVAPPAHTMPFAGRPGDLNVTYIYAAPMGIEYQTNGLVLVICLYPRLDDALGALESGVVRYLDPQTVDKLAQRAAALRSGF